MKYSLPAKFDEPTWFVFPRDMLKAGLKAEIAAQNYYKKKGFNVVKICPNDDEQKTVFLNPEAKRLVKRFGLDFERDLGIFGLPDLVCVKGKKIFFVEAKYSFNPHCKPGYRQISQFDRLQSMGWSVNIFILRNKKGKKVIRTWSQRILHLFEKQEKVKEEEVKPHGKQMNLGEFG